MLIHIAKFFKIRNIEPHAYYDFTKLVGYDCALEITPWHRGVSWRNTFEDTDWRHNFYDDPQINFSFLVYADVNPQWVSHLPENLIQPLIKFEASHTVSMYPVLWILSRSPAACDLFISAPFLFWIIISSTLQTDFSEQEVLSIFAAKRHNILSKFGLPSEKPILNFIAKLSYTSMNNKRAYKFRRFIQMCDYKGLNHISSIPFWLVELLLDNPQITSARFIRTIDTQVVFDRLRTLLGDIYEMADQLNEPSSLNIINGCKNLAALEGYHNRLSVRINQICPEDIVVFRKTNLIENPHIHAILSNIELRDEGIEMDHCIFSYSAQVACGEYAVFKVLFPERSTLGITISHHRQYSIDQIQGKQNGSVGKETSAYVRQWFYNQLTSE